MAAHVPIRVWPSHLAYMRHLHLVEERHGSTRLFPHTEQLPAVYNAIHHEFLAGIPSRLAATDHRADDFRKFTLAVVMEGFCMQFNASCEDRLVVFPYFTRDGVARLSVVQEVRDSQAGGIKHRFRFFAGKDFLPSVCLSGKHVAFTSHVLERFQQRATKVVHPACGEMLRILFTAPVLSLQANGHGQALASEVWSLVFPFIETETEILFTTCLTLNELRSLTPIKPPRLRIFHYGQEFQPPTSCDCTDEGLRLSADAFIAKWRRGESYRYRSVPARAEWLCSESLFTKLCFWPRYCKWLQACSRKHWKPNAKWEFHNGLYGPCMLESPAE